MHRPKCATNSLWLRSDFRMCGELYMNTNIIFKSRWSTASFGDTADTSAMELSALGAHLELCQRAHGRLFFLQCAAQTMHGFVVGRFVTTVVVVTLLIGVFSMVL